MYVYLLREMQAFLAPHASKHVIAAMTMHYANFMEAAQRAQNARYTRRETASSV